MNVYRTVAGIWSECPNCLVLNCWGEYESPIAEHGLCVFCKHTLWMTPSLLNEAESVEFFELYVSNQRRQREATQ